MEIQVREKCQEHATHPFTELVGGKVELGKTIRNFESCDGYTYRWITPVGFIKGLKGDALQLLAERLVGMTTHEAMRR